MNAVRCRVFIDAVQVAEGWIPVTATDGGAGRAAALAADHVRMVEDAIARGGVWLVELFDPGMPEADAYMRFGTDRAGMTAPVPLDPGAAATVMRMWAEGTGR